MDKFYTLNEVLSHLPIKRSQRPGGWVSFNCPHCINNGETPDKRMRGGIKILGDGGFALNCFNCGYKTVYYPGESMYLSNNLKKYLESLGLSDSEIQKISFNNFQIYENIPYEERSKYFELRSELHFKELKLPEGSKPLLYWVNNNKAIDVAEYIINRGVHFFKYYPFYWTPIKSIKENGKIKFYDLNERIIIPFYYKNKIVGWNGRLINNNSKNRYIGYIPQNFMFNMDLLYSDRKYLLITEGVLDAISLNCIGSFGNSINDEQITLLNSSGKEIIILPDRDKAGEGLLEIAKDNNWKISIPWKHWGLKIKDATDAVKEYGKIWTLKSVLSNMTDDYLKAQMEFKLR